jgi:hypothetical protein
VRGVGVTGMDTSPEISALHPTIGCEVTIKKHCCCFDAPTLSVTWKVTVEEPNGVDPVGVPENTPKPDTTTAGLRGLDTAVKVK